MTGAAVEAEGLAKSFDSVRAVDGLSFSVEPGQVVGLLGPNGAGKTTTVRLLVGLIRPDAGKARLLGEDIKPGAKVLARVGALVEKPAFVPYLSGLENLRVHWLAGGDKWPAPGLEEALVVANLGDAVHRKTRGYSQGMRQRLGIAQALLNRPDLLILDEPTNGLDPAETRRLRGAIRTIADRGTTILVSSHILAEVEQVCTHALVVDHGKLVAQGTVADLVGASSAIDLVVDDETLATKVLQGIPGVLSVGVSPVGGLVVDLDGVRRSEVVAALVHSGVGVDAVTPRRRLEDAYLRLVEDDGL
ncbi:MAG: type transport system ATP-binding protein [Acidimicrobiaceae bacterium]|jgi:ABC-2 type transport system ATP-binding protein